MSAAPPPRGFTAAEITAAIGVFGAIGTALQNWEFIRAFLIDAYHAATTPLFEAIWMSQAIGLGISLLLPHLPQQIGMKADWTASHTKARIRLWCCLLTFVICWYRMPTSRGFWYAGLTGLAAMGMWTTITGLIYRLFPCARPESLQQNPGEKNG